MWWRLSAKEFAAQRGEGNRRAMRRIVESGEIPGLLAYRDGEPIGWCSVAPREAFLRLERSPLLERIDDQPVWSIVCFYVASRHRRQGMMEALIRGAIDYVRTRGGRILEAYPVEPKSERTPPLYLYHGVPSAFHRAGFVEVARRSERRTIVRYTIPEEPPID